MTRTTPARHRLGQALIAVGLIGAGPALLALPASADPTNSHASCLGFEASGISPAGSSVELPGGMPELHALVVANFPHTPAGLVYSSVAHEHAGSHDACD